MGWGPNGIWWWGTEQQITRLIFGSGNQPHGLMWWDGASLHILETQSIKLVLLIVYHSHFEVTSEWYMYSLVWNAMIIQQDASRQLCSMATVCPSRQMTTAPSFQAEIYVSYLERSSFLLALVLFSTWFDILSASLPARTSNIELLFTNVLKASCTYVCTDAHKYLKLYSQSPCLGVSKPICLFYFVDKSSKNGGKVHGGSISQTT